MTWVSKNKSPVSLLNTLYVNDDNKLRRNLNTIVNPIMPWVISLNLKRSYGTSCNYVNYVMFSLKIIHA